MKSTLATICLLFCTACHFVEGPVMINNSGEPLRAEVTYFDSGPYVVVLEPKACLWEGKPRGQYVRTKHVRLIGKTGLKQEIDVAALLAKTPDPKNTAIIVEKSSIEITSIKEARTRRLLP